ncbi:hypothetical protein JHK87_003551 [Glycine soja]|nr:hypothetical protein JHK87_003551 [Glycine soja]
MFGKIPSEIGNLVNLFVLSILYNHFEGIIPSAFGKLQKMQALELSGNKLSGVIPTSIGHFSRLFYLGLGENIGAIPLEIFNLSSLTDALAVSQNSLSGSIPKEILDPSLVPNHGEAKFEEENGQNLTPNVEKCLVSLFNIGISCSVESPKERMNMVDVTRELSKTRKTFIVGVETREEFKSAAEMDTRNKSEHFSTADMKKGIITFRIDDRIEIKK